MTPVQINAAEFAAWDSSTVTITDAAGVVLRSRDADPELITHLEACASSHALVVAAATNAAAARAELVNLAEELAASEDPNIARVGSTMLALGAVLDANHAANPSLVLLEGDS